MSRSSLSPMNGVGVEARRTHSVPLWEIISMTYIKRFWNASSVLPNEWKRLSFEISNSFLLDTIITIIFIYIIYILYIYKDLKFNFLKINNNSKNKYVCSISHSKHAVNWYLYNNSPQSLAKSIFLHSVDFPSLDKNQYVYAFSWGGESRWV